MTPDLLANERFFIGCLLRNPFEYWEAKDLMRIEMLTGDAHRGIYEALGELMEKGRPVTSSTLQAALPEEYEDGKPYVALVAVLKENAADAGSALDYAGVIREDFKRRRIVNLVQKASKAVKDPSKCTDDILAGIEAELLSTVRDSEGSNIKWLHDAAEQSLKSTAENYRVKEEIQVGLRTGIMELDKLIGPIMGGDLVTLAAPSGHGKTTLAMQILRHASRPGVGKPAFLISMEMQAVQIARRAMATWADVSVRKQRAGDIEVFEFERLRSAAARAAEYQILIDETGRQTTSRICKKIRAMHRRYGLGCAAIDHVLLVKPDNPKWQKIETIEYAAMAFKELAKELDIPIFLLAQLTRGSQSAAASWRFTDQALYGGDAIKQASDVMIGVTLPRKWLRQREPESGTKEHGIWFDKMGLWEGKAEIGALKMRDDDDGHWLSMPFDGVTYTFGTKDDASTLGIVPYERSWVDENFGQLDLMEAMS